MKFVTQYLCSECGALADEHHPSQVCPQCGSRQFFSIQARCSCLEIKTSLMFQETIIIPDPNCEACNFK